jgi:hypothetical protein
MFWLIFTIVLAASSQGADKPVELPLVKRETPFSFNDTSIYINGQEFNV